MYTPSLISPARHPSQSLDATRAVAILTTLHHDLYGSIHKALRAFMCDTLVRVGRIDVHDRADSDEALDQLTAALDFLSAHIRHEDDFLRPAIESRQPSGADRVGSEHAAHADTVTRLREDGDALRTARGTNAVVMAQRLYLDLSAFVAETFEHLHHEETVLSPLLWQLFSDEELAAIHARLRASLSPADMLSALRWALPAGTPSERAALVTELKAAMPPEALAGVLGKVRKHIDATGWTKLMKATGLDIVDVPQRSALTVSRFGKALH